MINIILQTFSSSEAKTRTNSKISTWNILSENVLRSILKCPGYVQCASGLYLMKKV